MIELLLIIWFARNNSKRAKLKGLKPGRWAFLTVIAYIVGELIGAFIVILIIRKGVPYTMNDLMNQNSGILLNEVFGIFCGVGGYLFVRHQLQKQPDQSKTNDWMNNIGNNTPAT